jgi:hypothetical protein
VIAGGKETVTFAGPLEKRLGVDGIHGLIQVALVRKLVSFLGYDANSH